MNRLMKDWELRVRRIESGQSEVLRESFLAHSFEIYRLASRPEAAELGMEEQLIDLASALHELSSTAKYFGSWVTRDLTLPRIEGKFSECEKMMNSVMTRISGESL